MSGEGPGVHPDPPADLAKRELPIAEVGLNRPLQLVDLRGSGLKGIGADGRLIVGGDYSMARRWSKALHDHPQEIDGIWYRARNDPDRLSVAVYNRAAGVLEMVMEWKLASSAGLQRVLPIIDYYEFGIG